MFKNSYGHFRQVQFADEHEYYLFLGFLAKSDGSSNLVWEHNEMQGAWTSEGRIQLTRPLTHPFTVKLTAGRGRGIYKRINCNDFVSNIHHDHHFQMGGVQNIPLIRSTVPAQFVSDFDRGLLL